MNRITHKNKDTYFIKEISSNDLGYYGDAVDKLAAFEDMVEELILKNVDLSSELDALKQAGEMKSYKFRELLGHKLINSAMLAILESHNLKEVNK